MTAPLTIVTAADARYAGCLLQLLANLERRGILRTHAVIAFDLGLSTGQRAAIAKRFPEVDLRGFDLSIWPSHVAPTARTYAWKPIIVAQAAETLSTPLLWLDSATLVRTHLGSVRRAVARDGLFVLRGQTSLRAHCDPQVAAALGAEAPLLDHPEYVSGVVGADAGRPEVMALLRQWRAWALDPSLSAPQNPAHRNDQVLLSLLVLRAQASGHLHLRGVEDVDISAPHPIRCLSTRNKVPSSWPSWAEPISYAYFRAWKAIDQLAHRARRFKATRIDGLHRQIRERYEVRVRRCEAHEGVAAAHDEAAVARRTLLDGASGRVAPLRGGYLADPFPLLRNGRAWLFAEAFDDALNQGHLVAVALDAAGRAAAPQPLDLRYIPEGAEGDGVPMRVVHRSFPFVFTHAGALYMIPETCALRAVDLFVCDDFPRRWRWVRRLLDGVDAADSTVLRHEGRWWLFTSVRPQANAPRALEIHRADDLLRAPFIAHPVNPERRYAEAPHGTGRCAGTWVRDVDGAWLRPVQTSVRRYGEGMCYMRVDRLDPEVFVERPYTGSHPLSALAARLSPHHVAVHDDVVAYDIRTR